MQYREELSSGPPAQTPALRSLSVDYNRAHDLAFLSPGGEATWSGRELVRWTVNDPDNDTITTDLSVENGLGSVVLANDLPGDTTAWEWDTLGVPNGIYRLRLTARDSNSLIPLSVETVSGNITCAIFTREEPPALGPHARHRMLVPLYTPCTLLLAPSPSRPSCLAAFSPFTMRHPFIPQ